MDLDPRLRPGGGLSRNGISSAESIASSPSSAGAHDSSAHQQQDTPEASDAPENPENPDPKRPRACEACRGLKVRCDPDPEDDHGPCRRCRKAGRRCVVTAPTRKRQKKTDSRVSELEKKIDALTASLQARGAAAAAAAAAGGNGYSAGMANPGGGEGEAPVRQSMGEAMDRERSQRMGPPERTTLSSPSLTRRDHPTPFQPAMGAAAGMKRKASDMRSTIDEERQGSPIHTSSPLSPWVRPGQGDIVDRGMLSMDQAADLLVRYTDRMVPHFPAVIFPPSLTALELRRSKPLLFLAVMAASSGEIPPLQMALQRELMVSLAEKVFLSGEKNLEIVQALLVAVIWYWPPEHFEELKFYQLVHTAAVMAIDIGLGKKAPPRRAGPGLVNWHSNPLRRHGPPDPTTIESRRTWLGCYFLTCNTSIALHRPNLVRWTTFMSESIGILEVSPDAAPTDKYLCHLAQQHRLGEDIGGQFSLDDPTNLVDINDPRTQYALRGLERDLEKLRSAPPEDVTGPTLEIGYNMINLYMHEVALHTKAAAELIRPPFNADNFKDGRVYSAPLSPAHISAISACLSSVDGIFTTFLTMDVAEIRCLPVYNFVRVAYAVVILLKLYFSASGPDSELGKVIDKSNLRVEHYLHALIDKFCRAAADERSRPAAKFLVVLAMLKTWFTQHERQDGSKDRGSGDAPSSHQRQQPPPPTPTPQPPNTPLQLLSEVAAGSDINGTSHASGARAAFSTLSHIRQPPQPFFHDTASPSPSTPSQSHQQQQQQHQPQHHQQLTPFSETPASWPTPHQQHQQHQQHHHQQQQQLPHIPMDMTLMSSGPPGPDFSGTGFVPDGQEDGARIILSDAWFSDVFEGLHSMQDPNTMFPF